MGRTCRTDKYAELAVLCLGVRADLWELWRVYTCNSEILHVCADNTVYANYQSAVIQLQRQNPCFGY